MVLQTAIYRYSEGQWARYFFPRLIYLRDTSISNLLTFFTSNLIINDVGRSQTTLLLTGLPLGRFTTSRLISLPTIIRGVFSLEVGVGSSSICLCLGGLRLSLAFSSHRSRIFTQLRSFLNSWRAIAEILCCLGTFLLPFFRNMLVGLFSAFSEHLPPTLNFLSCLQGILLWSLIDSGLCSRGAGRRECERRRFHPRGTRLWCRMFWRCGWSRRGGLLFRCCCSYSNLERYNIIINAKYV